MDAEKIEAIKQSASQASSEGPAFMQPQAPPVKRGRGRPRKNPVEATASVDTAPLEPTAPQFETKKIVEPLVKLISSAGVELAGDESVRMSPEEIGAGAEALGMLIDKWMPTVGSQYGPEFACVMIFGQWGMRVYQVKREKEKEKRDRSVEALLRPSGQVRPEMEIVKPVQTSSDTVFPI